MINLFIPLLISTVFFFTTSLYYRSKYKSECNMSDLFENTSIEYYQQVVNLDTENESLKASMDQIKIENSELKSGIYTGYTSPTIAGSANNE